MEYSEKVMELFRNPVNVGVVENYDGKGKVGNPACGDIMELTIKVEDEVITEAKFRTFGCGAAIASSSMLTSMVIGKPIAYAEQISNKAVIKALGDLPPKKRHCSVLAEEALKNAIEDYHSRKAK